MILAPIAPVTVMIGITDVPVAVMTGGLMTVTGAPDQKFALRISMGDIIEIGNILIGC